MSADVLRRAHYTALYCGKNYSCWNKFQIYQIFSYFCLQLDGWWQPVLTALRIDTRNANISKHCKESTLRIRTFPYPFIKSRISYPDGAVEAGILDKTHRRQCKMSSSKKMTCRGTLRQVFIRVYRLEIHCNINPIYVFLFWELCGLHPNFHIHVSVSCERFIYSQERSTYFPAAEIYKSVTDIWA